MSPRESFGNYMLQGIEEITPAADIPWDFSAPGWFWLTATIILSLVSLLLRSWKKWHTNAYRRRALKVIDDAISTDPSSVLQQLPLLLKSTAITTYGRDQVATLYGAAWLAFLDQTALPGQRKFDSPAGHLLLALTYQDSQHIQLTERDTDDLITLAQSWISSHQKEVTTRSIPGG